MVIPRVAIEQSIPEQFEAIVRENPNGIAAKFGNKSLSYAALNNDANRIARALIGASGARPEPVAILLTYGLDMIAAMLGVLKTGKFYVILEPAVSEERCAYILENSTARMMITSEHHLELARKLTASKCIVVNINSLPSSSSEPVDVKVSPSTVAYLTYTSGSTGRPKGIIDIHRNILHSVVAHQTAFQTCPDDNLSLIHSFSFAAVNSNLYQSLLTGATLSLFSIQTQGAMTLVNWLREERITVCHLPVSLFREVAALLSERGDFPNLRLLVLSGSPITKHDFECYRTLFPQQMYLGLQMGSTETKILCVAVVGHNFEFPSIGSPIGYAVPGKKISLLDDDGCVAPPGETGEIVVDSPYLTLGYWNGSAPNNTNFALDPGQSESRRYHTGDLGKMLPDGFLIHLGRKDLMVKIRGYRVEIEEIERKLNQHLEVKSAGVKAWQRKNGEKYLAAYIVSRHENGPGVDQLQTFLRETVPEFMVPSAFVFLDSLPLANGKLDRSALAEPSPSRPNLSTPYAAPTTQIEKTLARIWDEVLDVRCIGIHDKFLDLGGHSLSATRIVSRVIDQFRLEISLHALLQSCTIADMADIITKHQEQILGQENLTAILDKLESLSDEEVRRILGEGRSDNSKKD